MKDQGLYLDQIKEFIARIDRYTASGKEVLLNDEMVQDAVIRNFISIGEAVKRLDDAVKAKAPEVDWRGAAGFRDILAHWYDKVELDEVWEVIIQDLPILKAVVERLLTDYPEDNPLDEP